MKINRAFQSLPVYLQTRNKGSLANKTILAIASGLVSSAVALASDDSPPASMPTPTTANTIAKEEPLSEKLTNAIKEQTKIIEEIKVLSKSNPKESSEKLNEKFRELSNFYRREYPTNYSPTGYVYPVDIERRTLILSAKNEFQTIFQNLLSSLDKGTAEEKKLALGNIQSFNMAVPWYDMKATHLIDENALLEQYFEAKYKGPVTNVDETISMLELGKDLLSTAIRNDDNSNCSKTFCLWIEKISNSEMVKGLSKEDAKKFHTAVLGTSSKLIQNSWSYLAHGAKSKYSTTLELFIPLTNAAINVMKQNTGDIKFLSNEILPIIRSIKNLTRPDHVYTKPFPEEREKVNRTLIPLFDITFQAIFNLPQKEEKRTAIIADIFYIINYFFKNDPPEIQQKQVIDPLNKYCFSNSENSIGDFNLFMKSVFNNTQSPSGYIGFSSYILFQLINDHPDHFLKSVQSVIDQYKSEGSKKDSAHFNALIKYFHLFTMLHRVNITDMVDENTSKKVLDWSRQNIEEPIFQILIEDLDKQKVNVKYIKTHARQEKYIYADQWREFNKLVSSVVEHDPYFAGRLLNILKKKIENNSNSYERQILLEALAMPLRHELEGRGNYSVLHLLQERMCQEDMPHAMETIGNLIAEGIKYEHRNTMYSILQVNEPIPDDQMENWNHGPGFAHYTMTKYVPKYMQYKDFFNRLNEYSNGNIMLSALSKKGDLPFTKIQEFILDIISISEGDTKQIQQLTGVELNPPTFWKTYKNKITGEKVTVEITDSGTEEQRAQDKKYSMLGTYELIEEKVDRSKQNPRDFQILMQARRNARAALAYIGAQLVDFNLIMRNNVACPKEIYPYSGAEITRLDEIFRKTMVKMLERHIGWYSTARYLGYEVGPYIDLCTVAELEAGKETSVDPNIMDMNNNQETEMGKAHKERQYMTNLITKQFQSLKQILLDDENARLKWSKIFKDQELARLNFIKQVLDSAPSGQRMSFIDFLAEHLGFSRSELHNIDEEIKNTKELLKD